MGFVKKWKVKMEEKRVTSEHPEMIEMRHCPHLLPALRAGSFTFPLTATFRLLECPSRINTRIFLGTFPLPASSPAPRRVPNLRTCLLDTVLHAISNRHSLTRLHRICTLFPRRISKTLSPPQAQPRKKATSWYRRLYCE